MKLVSAPSETASALHSRASVLLTTETGSTLKVTGLTSDDIENVASLIADIAARDPEVLPPPPAKTPQEEADHA